MNNNRRDLYLHFLRSENLINDNYEFIELIKYNKEYYIILLKTQLILFLF